MNNCCEKSVPQSDSSFETFAGPVADWTARLTAGLTRSVQASDQTLGHLEEEILCQTRGLERKLLEAAAQKKADQTPPRCPVCGQALTRRTHDHQRTYQTRFGPVTIRRLRGWCRRCRAWRFPADHALGLSDTGSASPSVQEMAALVASKMPVAEASAVMERLTGVKLPPATLDREARRQGQRAERKRKEQDEQMRTAQGVEQRLPQPEIPFTLIIELDAWNIRERDEWGRSAAARRQGREPERWHWVYGGTCFRLDQRVESDRGRPCILSRGTVMTRHGVESLRDQLFAEAQRHGLAAAAKVLVVADGAVWIWNLTGDRFPQAHQRLDYYHASEHLWGRVPALLNNLRTLVKRLRRKKRAAVAAQLAYLESHQYRMDYAAARRTGEPEGSGAMESTGRQYQCRFKRPGQFWSRAGDEALMCLETFWRNDRWHLLFPHIRHQDPRRN